MTTRARCPEEAIPTAILSTGLSVIAFIALCTSSVLAQTTAEIDGVVRIEAESPSANIPRTLSNPDGVPTAYGWSIPQDVGGFDGSGALRALPDDGTVVASNWSTASPELQFSINFTTPGTYYVWLRGYADTAGSLSVYVGVDGLGNPSGRIDLPKTGAWVWANTAAGASSPVAVTVPSAGAHTLHVWMGGAGVALDKIVLTANGNYSPQYSPDFWRNQSIYQIVTDRFFDGDPSNNTASPNYVPADGGRAHGGDFKGIERKLDYIKALGATAIWISPVVKNGSGDYHGYAATDFYQTDPRMGTLAELKSLVVEAHKRGLLVINDVVVNHAGTLVDSADAGWPNFKAAGYNLRYSSGTRYAAPFDDASVSAAFGNADLRNIFHNYGQTQNWGDPVQVEFGDLLSLDDLRTENGYVRQKMKEIWSYWINEIGFDAFRLDTVKHVEMGFWDEWSPAMRAAAAAADKPNFFQFGEILDGSDAKVGSYTGSKSGGNYKMESAIDYPLYFRVGSVFASASGDTAQIEGRYSNLSASNYDASALNSLVLNIDNHDNPRFLSIAGSTPERLELALVFLHTARGIPSLYYGTEQDFNGGGDPDNREDMFDGQFEQGPSAGDNFNMTSPRFRLVSKLNNLRRNYPALRTGSHENLWADWDSPGILAYARRLGGQEVYIVLNTATTSQTVGTRPTIHPAGTVLVNVLNPAETLTVTSGADGIPSIVMPATSCKMFVAESQSVPLSPVVEAVSPAHDAVGISPAAPITVTFSRAMNTAAVQAAFATTPEITGSFAWSDGNKVLSYTPASLSPNTTYTLKIGGTATDSNGLAVYAPFESRFRTGVAAVLAPPAINAVATSGAATASANLTATITPNGSSTTVYFEYGPTAAYGSVTTLQTIGTGFSPLTSNATIYNLSPGTTYHFRVVARNAEGTTTGSDGTFATASVLPQVITLPAQAVTSTTANLLARVNPQGTATSVYFEYGTNPDALEFTTAPQNVGSGVGSVQVEVAVSALAPGTTYVFRPVATSGANAVRGSLYPFTTLAVKPSITSSGASGITATGATLNAAVTANGFDSQAWFEYGADNTYGHTTSAQAVPASGTNVAVSVPIDGLPAGRICYFRAIATNAYGMTYSGEKKFTAGFPPPALVSSAGVNLDTNNTAISAFINPNGLSSGFWVDYGAAEWLGATTRKSASDNLEDYPVATSYKLIHGKGFSNSVHYSRQSYTWGDTQVVATNSTYGTAGRMLDGNKSYGVRAAMLTQSGYRPFANSTQSGSFSFSMRCDVDNSTGFSGLNLKSLTGDSFVSGELVSVGMMPANGGVGGNNAYVVSDFDGQKTIDFGLEMRGAIVDVKISFNTLSGDYTVDATRRADAVNAAIAKSVSGFLKRNGPDVKAVAFGYMNANTSGAANQNLIFDSTVYDGLNAVGSGTDPVQVLASLGNHSNSYVFYRVSTINASGTSAGPVTRFFTGADLYPTAVPASSFKQGGTGTFAVTVSNLGIAPSTGSVTVQAGNSVYTTVAGMSGEGWTYDAANNQCTRSDALAGGSSYPPITVAMAFATNAPSSIYGNIQVGGGGDGNIGNNSQSVPFTVASMTPIESWRHEHFGSSDDAGRASDLHDASGDGLPNLVKYALGLDPTKPNSRGRPEASTTDGSLQLTFTRRKDAADIHYIVEGSGNLASGWETPIYSSANTAYEGGTNASCPVTVSDNIPILSAPGGKRFMRLRVVRP